MAIRQTILAEKDCYRIDATNHIVSNGIEKSKHLIARLG